MLLLLSRTINCFIASAVKLALFSVAVHITTFSVSIALILSPFIFGIYSIIRWICTSTLGSLARSLLAWSFVYVFFVEIDMKNENMKLNYSKISGNIQYLTNPINEANILIVTNDPYNMGRRIEEN